MLTTEIAIMFNKKTKHINEKVKKAIREGKFKEGQCVGTKYLDSCNRYKVCYELSEEIVDWLVISNKVSTKHSGKGQKAAIDTVEQLLNITLNREYKVKVGSESYYIDGYDKNSNIAYEVDEDHHYQKGELREHCVSRQKAIEGEIGCSFVRISI